MNKDKNFISEVFEEDDGAKVSALDATKPLFVDQYNSTAKEIPDFFQHAKTIKDVFEYFKPSVDVDFVGEDKIPTRRTLEFRELKDFDVNKGKGKLVANSDILSRDKYLVERAARIRKQLESDGNLQKILNDNQGRKELITMLKHLQEELINASK